MTAPVPAAEDQPGRGPARVAAQIVRLRGELVPNNGAGAIIVGLGPVGKRDGWAGLAGAAPVHGGQDPRADRAGQGRAAQAAVVRRFALARPRDRYQVDATEVKLATGEAVVVFEVLDDCTRLSAAAAASTCGAPGIMLRDNGTAFSGSMSRGQGAFARADTAMGARIIRSSPYHPQTCGKSSATRPGSGNASRGPCGRTTLDLGRSPISRAR